METPVGKAAVEAPTREKCGDEENRDVVQREDRDIVQFQHAWTRFQYVYRRRKAFFHRDDQQKTKTTQRLFILSRDNDPWESFGLKSRLAYRRRVYETCGLHFTKLHAACASGDKTRVQKLLDESRDSVIDLLARDSSGRIPLHHAVFREHHGMIRLLLKQPNARLQLHDRDNRDTPPVQYALERIYRLALKDPASFSVAMRATRLWTSSKRFQRLWRLADRMLLSMESGLVQKQRWLDCTTRGDSWDAVRTGDVDRLQMIHKLYEKDDADSVLADLGYSLLHEACSSVQQDLKTILYLLSERGLDRTQKTQSGATPLHCAACCGWLEACVLLLDEDVGHDGDEAVDPEELLLAIDHRGRTALHACLVFMGRGQATSTRNDMLMTARYLAQRCPQSLQVVDLDGLTPMHYAVTSGDLPFVELLITMGASLFHEIQSNPPRREYGDRADWAPCWSRFQRPSVKPSQLKDPKLDRKTISHLLARSMACERMHRVKAGHVEHPGEAVPMETLWFLLRRPQVREEKQREATPLLERNYPLRATKATDVSSDKPDSRRFGCRRFGAVCDTCESVPDSTLCGEQRVAMSVLTIALRCCRLCVTNRHNPDERFAIVKSLLLAGSAIDDAAIHEALRAVQMPCLVQLVLTYSGGLVTCNHMLAHFFALFGDHLHESDLRQAMLLSWLDTNPELFTSSTISSLFRWGYFQLVERILEGGDMETLAREVGETPQPASRHQPEITTSHLQHVRIWKARWADRSSAFMSLGVKCVDEFLHSPMIRNDQHRQHTDDAITAIVNDISAEDEDWGSTHGDVVFVDWIRNAIAMGFVQTAKRLWTSISSTPPLVVKLVGCLHWPLRLPFLQVDFTDSFTHELLHTVVNTVDLATADVDFLVTCFAIACMYTIPPRIVAALITRLKLLDTEPVVMAPLVSTRFGGRTLPQWIVHNDRVDVAELLLSHSGANSELRERLWRALTMAAMVTPQISTARWRALLFPTQAASSRPEINHRQWLLTTLVRVQCSPPLFVTAVDWVCDFPTKKDRRALEWLETSPLVHDIARWNALGVMEQLVSSLSGPEVDASIWSRLMTKRKDVDSCSPLDLCELLGHHALARVMRRLVGKETLTQVTGECTVDPWSLGPRRRFGLLRTLLSLPPTDPSTALVSARRVTTDPLVVFGRGDWIAAAALNNLRLLEVLHQHDVPLATTDQDEGAALASVLAAAIAHASLDALQWLLREKLPGSTLSKRHTRALVFQAARHTSVVHATMTLLLLQQASADPGRLSGDGDDATLLHRTACFSDTSVAASIFTLLLAMQGSDVNAHDARGVTPIAYAFGVGNLANACFLLSHTAHIRLEAEFEGQTAVYYTLQLLPSLAWRWILQTLLISKRHAAFLHCTRDDCACKGFERANDDTAQANDAPCSFCNHLLDSHTRVPFPPWFRDQYDSYLDPKQVVANVNNSNNSNDVNVGRNEEDEDNEDEGAKQRQLRAHLETPLVDEATLEHDRGRLNVHDLERITRLRFGALITTYAVESLPTVSRLPFEDSMGHDPDDHTKVPTCNANENTEPTRDSVANLALRRDTKFPIDASDDALSPHRLPSRDALLVPSKETPQIAAFSPCIPLALLPWFLRDDVAMVVWTNAFCGRGERVDVHTTTCGHIRMVLTRWLRLTAARFLGWPQSDRATRAASAFRSWRDVTITATSTCVSFRGRAEERGDSLCSPVALDPSKPVPRQEEPTSFSSCTSSFCFSSSWSLAPTDVSMAESSAIGSLSNTNQSLSIFQLFLHHWRYARVYQCFRLWKRRCERATAQVTLHALETLADTWAAEARRPRLEALMARHRALENTVKSVSE